jgi:hypothetical protein
MRKLQVALMMLKQAGLAGDAAHGLLAATKGFLGSGKHISKVMAQHGVSSPVAHAAAKLAPYGIAALGAKKVYESEPAQKLRYRWALHKQRKAMEDAQQGSY